MPVALVPIYINVPDNPALHATQLNSNQYRLSMDNMGDLQRIMSDRELFAGALYSSVTDAFRTMCVQDHACPARLQATQGAQFGAHVLFLGSECASLPPPRDKRFHVVLLLARQCSISIIPPPDTFGNVTASVIATYSSP